jgi:pSer/pThr/pTyr-binding forkhead associated (FHA) protein
MGRTCSGEGMVSEHLRDSFLSACGASGPLWLDAESPGGADRRWILSRPFAVVGRDPGADLILDHAQVSRRHAYLQVIAGRVFCVDLGSRTGVAWEGRPRRSGWVDRQQRVRIGPFQIRAGGSAGPADLEDPLTARSLEDPPLPAVTLEFPQSPERPPWRLGQVLTLVGRSPECRLTLVDTAVSRYHFSLLRTPMGLWVVDLLGKGGILVNGQRLRWGRLDHGDQLQVGHFLIRIRCGDPTGGSMFSFSVRMPALGAETVHPELAGPSRSRDVAEPSDLPAPLKAELTEPILTQMANQFGQMQQQMFDQFQQVMMMMAQTFGTLQRDQMGLVREELDRLRQLNQDLNALQVELAARSSAAPPPASPPPGDASMAAALARIEALLLASPPRLGPAPAEGGPAGPTLAGQGPERGSLPPPLGEGEQGTIRNGAQAVEGPSPAERTAGPSPSPAGKQAAACPGSLPDDTIHMLLSQRIAAIQQERQGRWQRVLDLMLGR